MRLSIEVSCLTFFICLSLFKCFLGRLLIATNSLVSLWIARCTFPKAPLPITFPIE